MHKKSTIEKAWKTMMARLHVHDKFNSSFWSRPQPAFRRSKDGKFYLDLVYGSRITYGAGINSGPQTYPATEKPVNVLVHEELPLSKSIYAVTMRQFKELENIEFKRIWLETAIGHTLYKLGSDECDGKPFINKLDTIESLAIEYDLTHI